MWQWQFLFSIRVVEGKDFSVTPTKSGTYNKTSLTSRSGLQTTFSSMTQVQGSSRDFHTHVDTLPHNKMTCVQKYGLFLVYRFSNNKAPCWKCYMGDRSLRVLHSHWLLLFFGVAKSFQIFNMLDIWPVSGKHQRAFGLTYLNSSHIRLQCRLVSVEPPLIFLWSGAQSTHHGYSCVVWTRH